MEKNDRKPEIRFSGFETSWKKKCFGDEFDILSNNTLSRDCLNYNQGIAKNVHYGDVLIKFNEYLDASKEVLPYIEDEKVIDKFQNSFLRDGDIVIADTAEDETVGKCTEIGQIRDLPIIAGLHTMPCRPKSKYAPMYLGYYLNANAYHRELLPLMQGVKVTSISRSGVKDTDIIVSEEYDEQKKIGQYLFALDEKIKFEKNKLDRLIILKKTMLVKMFPQGNSKVPEIRFGNYTDEWEQRKLLDSLIKVIDFRGRTPKKLGMDWSEEGYLALSALNVKDGYIDESIDAHYGNQELYDKWMTGNELHKGQVLFTTEAPMGNVAQVPDNKRYILSQRTIAFEVDEEDIIENYLAITLTSPNVFNKLTALSSGGTAKGVSQKSMSELTIPIPKDTAEQKKIGEYFQNLDNLITLHQRKVDKLKNIKSSCMDKMFV